MKTPWAWVRSLFTRSGEDPRGQVRYVLPYGLSGVDLNADDAMSLSTVWACVDVIARNIASCDWNIYQPVEGTNRRIVLDGDMKTWMLNTRPNPEMTAIGFREAMLFQAIPGGNAYAEIVRDRGGRVAQLWPLMADRVTPRRDPETWALYYEYTQPGGEKRIFTPDSIFHLRGPGMYGLMGENIIARAAKSLGVAAAQERFSATFFGQGAQPSGVLEFPGKLAEDSYQRLKDSWDARNKGPANAHRPLILESGMKWTTVSTEPQKSQLVESRKFSVEEICRWFGVPPHKVQHLEHATFSNIEHSSIEFVRDALTPWACRLQQEADAKLFDQNRGPWKYTEIDLRPLTRGDAQSRALAQASWRQNGIMSSNEIRAQEGLDDCGDDGDVLLVQANMTTVEHIVNPPSPAAPPALASGDELDPETDDEVDPAVEATYRMAFRAALDGAFGRYDRRMKNRRIGLGGADDENAADFKRTQVTSILEELAPFKAFAVRACGRELEAADIERFMAARDLGVSIGTELAVAFPSAVLNAGESQDTC